MEENTGKLCNDDVIRSTIRSEEKRLGKTAILLLSCAKKTGPIECHHTLLRSREFGQCVVWFFFFIFIYPQISNFNASDDKEFSPS